MANFTLTSSDKNTSDLASRTDMTTGGTLSNGVENKAGILPRIFSFLFVLNFAVHATLSYIWTKPSLAQLLSALPGLIAISEDRNH